MHLQTGFAISNDNHIDLLGYNQDKNILYASCRDGGFLLWKVHHEWRNKLIEQEEQEAFAALQSELKNKYWVC